MNNSKMTVAEMIAAWKVKPDRADVKVTILAPRRPAVWLEIGGPKGLHIGLEHKPNFFHRFMVELVFGFKYRDPIGDPNVSVRPA